ncbi:MAG: sigma 54-interacting transcriptional regulator, partial [Acidaminobacteraceae bacterium]
LSLDMARNIMIEKNIGRLPVISNEKMIGVIRSADIRDKFYMKMEEVSRHLNHVINNIHEGICVINSEGIVTIWNTNAELLYGTKAIDIIGDQLKNHFPQAILLKVLKEKEAITNVYHSPRPNSNIAISAHPIYINGEFVGGVSTDRDITEVEKLSDELQMAREKVQFLENEFKRINDDGFDKILGKSTLIRKNIEIARQVAKTNASILIYGESGTGKEVFSRAIHEHSERTGLFVPVNCSAIPNELFESEFFGHEAGAFTGASKKGKVGIFELADNGTIFLDELADLPMHMQAKLLRVLQESEFRRVGGEIIRRVDVRIISATNKDLVSMVESGEFREDLYFRLNVIEMTLPALRKREHDIDLFINKFLKEICAKNKRPAPKFDSESIKIMRNYKWKGNIRELKNTIEHIIILNKEKIITKDMIPSYIRNESLNFMKRDIDEDNMDLVSMVRELEKTAIKRALELSGGKKSKAAKLLNIPRTTLYYKIGEYDL